MPRGLNLLEECNVSLNPYKVWNLKQNKLDYSKLRNKTNK